VEIVIRLSPEALAVALANGKPIVVGAPGKKGPGRPTKEEAAKKAAAAKKAKKEPEEDEEEETEETEEEETEEETEDETEEETEEEETEEDEDEVVSGDQLKKLKAALTAFSKHKKSKDAAVKVLRKFAPSSEKVKVSDLPKLMKALKVVAA
jgi:hypothetical protein